MTKISITELDFLIYNSNSAENDVLKQHVADNKTAYQDFLKRISQFENIDTLAEALELQKKILPVSNEVNRFDIGNAKCVVIKRDDNLRISVESDTEVICYDFV